MTYLRFSGSINVITQCAIACETCAGDCLTETDVKELVDCIKSNLDCARLCFTLLSVMARNGPAVAATARACAEACRLCAEECEKHEYEHCRKCALACREAVDECEAIA